MLKVKVKEGILTEAQVSCFFIIDRDFLSTVDPWTTQRLEAPTLLPVEYPCITLILYIHCSSVSKVPSNGRLCTTAQSVFLLKKKIFFWTVVFLLKKFCVVFTTKKRNSVNKWTYTFQACIVQRSKCIYRMNSLLKI